MRSDVSAAALAPFRDLVQKHSGLQVPDYRLPELKRALDELLATTGLQSLGALLERLSGPIGVQERQRLIHQMTVGETYFFRDGGQFKALEQEVLPLLIRQRRHAGSLRIWSAACSTGEEPYSLAVLVHRLLRRELSGWRIVILGTDINQDALSRARQAQYRPWSLRATPDYVRDMYFQAVGEMWELRPEIRRMVTFQPLNLVKDRYPESGLGDGKFDLILCRNVLIYFDRTTSQQVVERLHGRLTDQGLLTVGFAEHQPGLFTRYERVLFGGVAFYRPLQTPSPAVGNVSPTVERPKPRPLHASPAPAPPPTAKRDAWRPAPAHFSSTGGLGPAQPATSDRAARLQGILALWQKGERQKALDQIDGLLPAEEIAEQQLYQIAHILVDAQRWETAEEWLDYLLSRRPLNAQGHYLYGLLCQATGREDDALTAFRRAVYLDKDFALAHFALASLFHRRGHLRRARKALDAVETLITGRDEDEPLTPDGSVSVRELKGMIQLQRHALAKTVR